MRTIAITGFISTLLLNTAMSEEPEAPAVPPSIEAVRTTETITIDGRLTESVWQRPGVTAFRQLEPLEGKPATELTEVWVAYDNDALYIAARMHDSAPDSIVARLARRDGQISTDDFGVFLDPYHDKRSGSYFGVSAAGTLFDGVLYNDDWNDNTWDGVWEGKARIDPEGWTAELRIPFSQLRFKPGDKQVWGIDFTRDISRKNEKDYIVYTPKNESGFVSRFVDLVGIDNIETPGRFEFLPYLSTKAEYTHQPSGDPFNSGTRYSPNVGADMKFGLGSNITVDATINPDFGQVEVDPAVVNLSDVETYFDEKRPFFIEGSTIFNFGQGGSNNFWGFNWGGPSFFYSRRIGRTPQGSLPDNADYTDVPNGTSIIGAAKLSGKLGDSWNVGAINAVTARELADVDTGGRHFKWEVEPLTYYGIFRGQKEFDGGKQGLGFLSTVTARSFSDDRLRDELNSNSVVFGIDGWTFLDSSKTWVVTGWTGTSYVRGSVTDILALQQSSRHYYQRPDAGYLHVDSAATHVQGYAGRFTLNKQRGDFYVNVALGFIDPGFDVNDLGFVWRTDLINGHAVIGYRWNTPNEITRRISLNGSIFRTYDFGGTTTWAGYWTNGFVQFLSYHWFDWFFAYNPESYSHTRTRGGPLTLNPRGYEIGADLGSDDRKDWILSAGTDITNYQMGVDHQVSVYAGLQYKPAANISLSINPSFTIYRTSAQWVANVQDPAASGTYGARYIFADLQQRQISASIRVDWTFTPMLSLQMYIQPLISVGEYAGLKELARPKSLDFATYGAGASTISLQDGTYTIDPDGGGPAQPYTLSNPDFNIKSLRGSAVLRWEYMPGSTLYFVWTQQRVNDWDPGDFRFGRDVSHLFRSQPDNIFLVKVSFWTNP